MFKRIGAKLLSVFDKILRVPKTTPLEIYMQENWPQDLPSKGTWGDMHGWTLKRINELEKRLNQLEKKPAKKRK